MIAILNKRLNEIKILTKRNDYDLIFSIKNKNQKGKQGKDDFQSFRHQQRKTRALEMSLTVSFNELCPASPASLRATRTKFVLNCTAISGLISHEGPISNEWTSVLTFKLGERLLVSMLWPLLPMMFSDSVGWIETQPLLVISLCRHLPPEQLPLLVSPWNKTPESRLVSHLTHSLTFFSITQYHCFSVTIYLIQSLKKRHFHFLNFYY